MEMETLKCLSMIDDEPNNWILNEEGFLFKIESRLRRFLRKLYRNKIMLLIHRWMPKKSDELRPRTCDYSVWWTSKETTNNFLEFYCLFYLPFSPQCSIFQRPHSVSPVRFLFYSTTPYDVVILMLVLALNFWIFICT